MISHHSIGRNHLANPLSGLRLFDIQIRLYHTFTPPFISISHHQGRSAFSGHDHIMHATPNHQQPNTNCQKSSSVQFRRFQSHHIAWAALAVDIAFGIVGLGLFCVSYCITTSILVVYFTHTYLPVLYVFSLQPISNKTKKTTNRLVVSQNQRALHIVFPHQFLDSPEWFGVSTDDFFQVSWWVASAVRLAVGEVTFNVFVCICSCDLVCQFDLMNNCIVYFRVV